MKPQIERVFKSNVPMAEHTTFRIGGPARLFCIANRGWQVERAIESAVQANIPWRVIGEGSNLLVSDAGIDSAVIAFRDDRPPMLDADEHVVVSGGTPLIELVFFTATHGFSGLEKLAGIPGSVGGAIAGNAGAYGTNITEGLQAVTLLCRDGSKITLSPDALDFDYRSSRLKLTGDVVLEARYRLQPGDRKALIRSIHETLIDRMEKHPDYRIFPTVGSFFKNLPPPPGESRRQAAGKLLDEVGAKALRIGDAGLWPKHANIVVNYGNASSDDVKTLTREMAKRVFEKFGITLEPEVTHL